MTKTSSQPVSLIALLALATLAVVFAAPPMTIDWSDSHANYPTNDCGHNWFLSIITHVQDEEGKNCAIVSRETVGKAVEQKMQEQGYTEKQIERFAEQTYSPENPLSRAINDALDEMMELFLRRGR